jgi:FKBP-type peptidyl-prolyl cis-trans isomerase
VAPPGTSGNAAQNGDTVSVHYIGTLDDGEEFDTSRDGDPFVLTIGGGGVIDGFKTPSLVWPWVR